MFVEGFNIPTLSIDYAQLLASIPVSFNGYPLGELGAASGATTQSLPVPENLIGFTNEVQIGGAAHSGFFLSGLTFDTGDIGTDPVRAVPEPPTLLLLGLGFAALLSRMRVCSRAQQSKNCATQVCSNHLRHRNLNSGLFREWCWEICAESSALAQGLVGHPRTSRRRCHRTRSGSRTEHFAPRQPVPLHARPIDAMPVTDGRVTA